jgi:hypothetical protein
MCDMRTTVDLPDELLRQAKSEAALRGRKLKDMIEEGLRLVMQGRAVETKAEASLPRPRKPSAHDLLKEWCGIYKDAPSDLSTNKDYFEDFGR